VVRAIMYPPQSLPRLSHAARQPTEPRQSALELASSSAASKPSQKHVGPTQPVVHLAEQRSSVRSAAASSATAIGAAVKDAYSRTS